MHDGVTVATVRVAGAAAVAGTAVVEVATAVPVVQAVIQVDPKGAVEATAAPVVVGVAAAEVFVYAPRPLLALQTEGPQERGVHHEGERFRAQVR